MIAMVRVLIAYCAVGAACLLTGCTTVHNANAPVEIRAASTSQHSDWQKLDFYVGGLSTWVAPKPTVVCSEISSAKESLDGFGHPTVVLIFDSEGARKMAELFKQRSSRPVAIVLDGKIIAAPVIMKPVSETLVVNFGKRRGGPNLAKELTERVNQQAKERTASKDKEHSGKS